MADHTLHACFASVFAVMAVLNLGWAVVARDDAARLGPGVLAPIFAGLALFQAVVS
jgi:hypothetical protein